MVQVSNPRSYQRSRLSGELPFRVLTLGGVMVAAALLFVLIAEIFQKSLILWSYEAPLTFLTSSGWFASVSETGEITSAAFGAFPMIWGTLVTSLIGIAIAAPIGIFTAIYLVELAPRRLAAPLTFIVEIVAAIPSVVVGLWALGELSPRIRDSIEWWIASSFGQVIPWLSEDPLQPSDTSVFRAGFVLAIMVTPMVAAVSREVIRSVPQSLREGMIGMGATQWETIRLVILPTARIGLIGAVLLAFGRAIGETIAVRLVIGMNISNVPGSLFQPGSSIAAQIAGAYGEATSIEKGALAGLGLALFGLTIPLSLVVRFLMWRSARNLDARAA
jgi:phosphate transport system permease protein